MAANWPAVRICVGHRSPWFGPRPRLRQGRVIAVSEFTVYYRAGCSLCDDMLGELEQLRPALGFVYRAIDISGDAALEGRYGEWVPVLMQGEHEVCHYFLDAVALRRCIGPA